MEKRVDFVVGGTQKGGTTALSDYLRKHPEICMAPHEGHFFDRDRCFEKTPVDYSDYHHLFESCSDRRLWGDKSPTYMYWYSSPRRIWEYNPTMKWIVLLRNPVDRAYSHWNMARRRGMDEEIDFLDAVRNERVRARWKLPKQDRRNSFVDRGLYSDQLRRIWFFFPREQTLIFKSDDFRTKQNSVLEQLCQFLGVELVPQDEPIRTGSSEYAPMTDDARVHLSELFEQEIRTVEKLLGWNCSDWLR